MKQKTGQPPEEDDNSLQGSECGKWRYLAVRDPSLVEDNWECKDYPDWRYGECGSPEQWWNQGLRNKFMDNRIHRLHPTTILHFPHSIHTKF